MILTYFPTDKLSINEITIEFGQSRELIRTMLSENYKAEDQVIPLDSSNQNFIQQKRDIYQNIDKTENFFFLGYNGDELLKEVEVHYCTQIRIFDLTFDFNQTLDSITDQLMKFSSNWKKNEGDYFFEDLKMVICDQNQMGGIGENLGYFYCASNVSHLQNMY